MKKILFDEIKDRLVNLHEVQALEKQFEDAAKKLISEQSLIAVYEIPYSDAKRIFKTDLPPHILAFGLGCEARQVTLESIVELFAVHIGYECKFDDLRFSYVFKRQQTNEDRMEYLSRKLLPVYLP